MHPLVLAERAAGEEVIFGHRADLDLQQEILVAGDVPRAGDFRMAGDLAREAVIVCAPACSIRTSTCMMSADPVSAGLITARSATITPSARSRRNRRKTADRSEEHTSELQSLMRNPYAVVS